MGQPVRVAKLWEIPPGSCKEVEVAGRVVAVFNVDGQLHALDGICPHVGGPLGQGPLTGKVVTCPWHGWQFDVTTGANTLRPALAQFRFQVEVQGDDVLVAQP
jgi:nitrite reductase/ring-hydroxylating ferredoxin subunit